MRNANSRHGLRLQTCTGYGSAAVLCALAWLPAAPADAAEIAVLGDGLGAQLWCDLFQEGGHGCTMLAIGEPMASFDPYDIIVVFYGFGDPNGSLADHMRAGRGVITCGGAPDDLGIDSDPLVQAWIGADRLTWGGEALLTATRDPILGSLPIGTMLEDCADSNSCAALVETTGHPGVKVLATYAWVGGPAVGILRNDWQGGRSVYFTNPISLTNLLHQEIILAAVDELTPPYPSNIPTASTWGLVALALLLASAASVLLRRRRGPVAL